jgi:cytochrome bd-type quinol oxidase subunit 2
MYFRQTLLFLPVAVLLGLLTAESSGRGGWWLLLSASVPLLFIISFVLIYTDRRNKRPMPMPNAWQFAALTFVLLIGGAWIILSREGHLSHIPFWAVFLLLMVPGVIYQWRYRRRPK